MTDAELAAMSDQVALVYDLYGDDRACGHDEHVEVEQEKQAVLAALEELAAWRAIGRILDHVGRDATGAIVTYTRFMTDCPLCHQRITGPRELYDGSHWPTPMRPLGHAEGCVIVKARTLLGLE